MVPLKDCAAHYRPVMPFALVAVVMLSKPTEVEIRVGVMLGNSIRLTLLTHMDQTSCLLPTGLFLQGASP